jgi:hypothetical protein
MISLTVIHSVLVTFCPGPKFPQPSAVKFEGPCTTILPKNLKEVLVNIISLHSLHIFPSDTITTAQHPCTHSPLKFSIIIATLDQAYARRELLLHLLHAALVPREPVLLFTVVTVLARDRDSCFAQRDGFVLLLGQLVLLIEQRHRLALTAVRSPYCNYCLFRYHTCLLYELFLFRRYVIAKYASCSPLVAAPRF